MSTTNVPAYQLLGFAAVNGTIDLPGGFGVFQAIVSVNVPPTTAPITGIDVEVTDVDFTTVRSSFVLLQMQVSGFGLSSPITATIGHTGNAYVPVQSGVYSVYYGNVRWFLPQGASGVDLTRGGTVTFGENTPSGGSVPYLAGVSYMIVWGVYSTVV